MKKETQQYAYHTASYYNYGEKLRFAKQMRRNPTEAEAVMWQVLRKSFPGVRFRRQHIIGEYVADFICLKQSLVIEIDGEYHNDINQTLRDEDRTHFLNNHGFRVLRFTNEEVLFNIDQVVETISSNLKSNQCPPK